jgi:hypothetical protein
MRAEEFINSRESEMEYILDRVEFLPSGCWEWRLKRDSYGYGIIRRTKEYKITNFMAHRISFYAFNGFMIDGMVMDHLCRNRACCNPDHLQWVTQKTNVRRGRICTEKRVQKTHCIRGHEFTEENTWLWRGWRYCRECGKIRSKKRAAITASHPSHHGFSPAA